MAEKTTTDDKDVVEIDEGVVKEIAKQAAEAITVDTEKIAKDAASAAVKEFAASIEGTDKKAGLKDDNDSKTKADQGGGEGAELTELQKMDSKMLFAKQAVAFVNGEKGELARFNQESLDRRDKAGYGNEGTSADGGYLVPDPEFDTTIYETLPRYGVVFKYGTTRQTDRNAIYDLSLAADLAFTEVGEAQVITSGKLVIGRGLKNLRKFGVIVPATEELDEDSIVDYWNIVTNSLARAYAKQADQLAFTDSSSGILHTAGVITQPVSGAGTTVTWDDLLKAENVGIEDDLDTSNFRWYMRRETWARLIQLKSAGSGEYLQGSLTDGWIPNPNMPSTPWGTPVQFTRVLPKSTEVTANGGFAVYCDLSQYSLVNKRGMRMDMLTEAVVKDTSGTDFNLATQDAKAMRAIIRMLGRLPSGVAKRFVVLGTGTVS